MAPEALPRGVIEPATIHDLKEAGAISPLAGMPAPKSLVVDLASLEREYYERKPDVGDPTQLMSFGTSGHRAPDGVHVDKDGPIMGLLAAEITTRTGKDPGEHYLDLAPSGWFAAQQLVGTVLGGPA